MSEPHASNKEKPIGRKNEAALVATAKIVNRILVIRGQKVIIDADLAAL